MNTLKQKGGKTREVEHLEHGLVDISSMLAEQTGLPHSAILTRYVWHLCQREVVAGCFYPSVAEKTRLRRGVQ